MQGGAGHLDLYHKCSICPYGTESMREFTNHVSRVHKNDPRFRVYCYIGNCEYTKKSWGGFKAHLSRYHKDIDIANDVFNPDDADHMPMEVDDDYHGDILNVLTAEHRNKMFFASYLLNLESTLRLSEKAVSVVAENTKLLSHDLSRKMSDGVEEVTENQLSIFVLCVRLATPKPFVLH